ncbi:MAG: VCBS repeat-containing protein [Thermoguttaceae bacterium]|nr:VCBS repeat-containing protein [Thermoguttaceae bacterium]MDW8077273.1 VCBS repeat-containing protein [Thermoguttaceae bacterium]
MRTRCALLTICLLAGIGGASRITEAQGLAQSKQLKFSIRMLAHDLNEGCAIGDINRDGLPDVVAGERWYAAPQWIPRPIRCIEQTMGDFYASNGDLIYDVDGDGWLDVISGSWMEPELYWFRNPGKEGLERAYKWERRVLFQGRGQNEKFALHDFDGDGIPEIFVNCWEKQAPAVVWRMAKDSSGKIIRKQDGTPEMVRIVIGAQGAGHGYAFGDINGDGREDLATEIGWYERPEGDPFARPWTFHPETALPHPSVPFLVVDLTGDRRGEIIWGKAHDYGLYWWEQGPPKADGTTTWKEHLIDNSWSVVHCLVWEDVDGDNKPELITGKRVRAHAGHDPGDLDPPALLCYKWDPSTRQFTRLAIADFGSGVGTGMQIAIGDLNGDKKPDIAVAGKSGTYLLFNEGFAP